MDAFSNKASLLWINFMLVYANFYFVTIIDTLSSRKRQKTDRVENTGIEKIRIRERRLGSKGNSWEYRVIATGVYSNIGIKLNRVCN